MIDFDTGPRFENPNDCRRLAKAYILYKDEPKYVSSVDDAYIGNLINPGDQNPKGLKVNMQTSKDVSLSSPELGFMNCLNGDAVYVYRKPNRQWHYLNEANCLYFSLMSQRHQGIQAPFFYCKSFSDMILGNYCGYPGIMKQVNEKPFLLARAFSRYFAIFSKSNKASLFYREEKIANYNFNDRIWELDKKFDYPTLIDNLEGHGLQFGV